MKKFKKIYLFSILGLGVLFLSACSVSTKGGTNMPTGNIFFSTDKGSTWREVNVIPTVSGQPERISGVNVVAFNSDPSDNLAVYLATESQGLFYTYSVGKGWQKTGLKETYVRTVAVDPNNKCLIYAAAANRLYKSKDCARSFESIYNDNNANVYVTSLVIDHYNPKNLYISTSRGEIIKSIDGGSSWRTIWRLEENIARLVISSLDSRRIFVATETNKVFSFFSNTDTNPATSGDIDKNFRVDSFKDLNAVLKDLDLGKTFADLVIANDGTLFLATTNMILRSVDDGVTWEKLSLIQPEKEAGIKTMTVNPQNAKEIYYATALNFFRSGDGGATWNSKRLPTGWEASDIMIDSKDANYIYLGAKEPLKEKTGLF